MNVNSGSDAHMIILGHSYYHKCTIKESIERFYDEVNPIILQSVNRWNSYVNSTTDPKLKDLCIKKYKDKYLTQHDNR